MRAFLVITSIALTACASAGAEDAMSDLKDQAINASPLEREIAASNTFYSCQAHPEPDRYDAICEVCSVDLYADKDLPFNADPDTEAPIVGVKGWATHFYHEFKPWGDDPNPRISATGERASQKFETSDLSVESIESLFSSANAWCTDRRDGEFRVLKNEIESFVGDLPS